MRAFYGSVCAAKDCDFCALGRVKVVSDSYLFRMGSVSISYGSNTEGTFLGQEATHAVPTLLIGGG